jgi:NAD(P)-dependent dehydrogenase (short-subunit alcohol dehydrogenase family)
MDRIALVTGAGSGIGRSTAIRLSRAGLRVVLASRRPDALAGTAAASPGPTLPIAADVTDPSAVDRLFSRVEHDCSAVKVAGATGPRDGGRPAA